MFGVHKVFSPSHRVNPILDEWSSQEEYHTHDRMSDRRFPRGDITIPPRVYMICILGDWKAKQREKIWEEKHKWLTTHVRYHSNRRPQFSSMFFKQWNKTLTSKASNVKDARHQGRNCNSHHRRGATHQVISSNNNWEAKARALPPHHRRASRAGKSRDAA